jgi:hypothetical protein
MFCYEAADTLFSCGVLLDSYQKCSLSQSSESSIERRKSNPCLPETLTNPLEKYEALYKPKLYLKTDLNKT